MIKRIDPIRPYVTSGGDRPAGGDRSAARDGVRRVEAATVVQLSEFAQRRNRERERAREEVVVSDAAAEETAAATGDAIRRQPEEATAAQPASPRDRVWLLTESGS